MMRSLFSGVTGLRSHQTRMDVIGNNIANVNTMGFKKSSVTFKDLYSETISAASAASGVGAGTTGGINAKQIGLGAQVNAVSTIHTPGSAQYTGNGMDVAISGDGYFVLETPEGKMYTRAGEFSTDQAGNLVSKAGYYVQVVAAKQEAVQKFSAKGVNDGTLVSQAQGISAPTGGVIQQGKITADLSEVEGRKFSFKYTEDKAEPWTATMQVKDFMPKGNKNAEITSDGWPNTDLELALEEKAAANADTATAGTLTLNFAQVDGANGKDTIDFNIGGINMGSHTFVADKNVAEKAAEWTDATFKITGTPQDGDKLTVKIGADTLDMTYQGGTWTPLTGTLDGWTVTFDPTAGTFKATAAAAGEKGGKPNVTITAGGTNKGVNGATISGGTFVDGNDAGTYAVPMGESVTVDFGNGFTFTVTNTSSIHWDAATAAQQITQALKDGSGFPAIVLEQNGTWTMVDDLDNVVDTVTLATTDATGGGITGDFLISTTEFGNFTLSLGGDVIANEGVLAKKLADAGSYFTVNVDSEWAVEYSSPGTVLESALQNLVVDFDMYGALAIDPSGAVVAQLDQDTQVSVDGQLINMKAGDKVVLGYIALANFNNPAGLEKAGDNLYTVSPNSGDPVFNMPGTGNAGALTPSNLEMSNVDLSEEIVNMIITQRGFQANSRIITTTDTMLEELVNLKR